MYAYNYGPDLNHGPFDFAILLALVWLSMPVALQLQIEHCIHCFIISSLCLGFTTCKASQCVWALQAPVCWAHVKCWFAECSVMGLLPASKAACALASQLAPAGRFVSLLRNVVLLGMLPNCNVACWRCNSSIATTYKVHVSKFLYSNHEAPARGDEAYQGMCPHQKVSSM